MNPPIPAFCRERPLLRFQKFAPAKDAAFGPADAESFTFGGAAAQSLPLNYTFIGWLLAPPAAGECVYVLRISRNDVWVPGIFRSSPIANFNEEGFSTLNSVYRWRRLNKSELIAAREALSRN